MREFLKRILPPALGAFVRREKDIYCNSHRALAYSQEGEDLILKRFFGDKSGGFYVDVGAHHPRHLSNTCLFYDAGWSGINIDVRPGMKAFFDRVRSRDVNLELALSGDGRDLDFSFFSDPAINTFRKANVEWAVGAGYAVLDVRRFPTTTLAAVLDQHHDPARPIDFMSVDVEGMDLEVLQGNNWQKYRPQFLLVESCGMRLDNYHHTEMHVFLSGIGYRLCAKTVNTFIYERAAS
jgi:hypothetical protein